MLIKESHTDVQVQANGKETSMSMFVVCCAVSTLTLVEPEMEKKDSNLQRRNLRFPPHHPAVPECVSKAVQITVTYHDPGGLRSC